MHSAQKLIQKALAQITKHTKLHNKLNKKTGTFISVAVIYEYVPFPPRSCTLIFKPLWHHFSIPGPTQSYHDWYVEEITELEDSTIGMWSEPLKIAKWIFHLSYLYLSFTCLIISLVVGLLVSVLTGNQSESNVANKNVDIMKVVDWRSASYSESTTTLTSATSLIGHLRFSSVNFTQPKPNLRWNDKAIQIFSSGSDV